MPPSDGAASVGEATLSPSASRTGSRRRLHLGPLVPVAIVSASLASAGTAAFVVSSLRGSATSDSSTPADLATLTSLSQSETSSATSIEGVAAAVSPAVVTITNSTRPSAFDPFSIPATGVGSGCIVASDGRILTPIEAAEALVDQASA